MWFTTKNSNILAQTKYDIASLFIAMSLLHIFIRFKVAMETKSIHQLVQNWPVLQGC